MFRDSAKSYAFIPALLICIGLISTGYCVRVGLEKFRTSGNHTVRVKGISERQVKSDYVIWDITFNASARNLAEARSSFAKSREIVLAFLQTRGFTKNELSESVPQTNVQHRTVKDEEFTDYTFSGAFTIKTERVDHVTKHMGDVSKLWEQGIMLGSSGYYHRPSVRYLIRSFDALRPEMLEEATKSARTMAERFAKHSKTEVGGILEADQGNFSISSTEGTYQSDQSLMKKIRVVSYVTYKLES